MFIALVFLISIVTIDLLMPRLMIKTLIRLRYYIALLGSLFVLIAVLFSRHFSLSSYVLGAVALMPVFFLIVRLLTRKSFVSLPLLPLLIVGSFLSSVLTLFPQSLLAAHNGYPNPLFVIPGAWWSAAIITVLEPRRYYSDKILHDKSQRFAVFFSIVIVPASVVFWLAFTQYIVYQANYITNNGEWCIRETDHTHLKSGLRISPRKMLFENSYKGSISPYLLLKLNGESWTHHWSFMAMDFVENETNSFLGGMSFYKTRQLNKPC